MLYTSLIIHMTSPEYISQYTGFSGTKLDSFVMFLNNHCTFDPGLNDYAALELIQNAFEDFVALNEEVHGK